MVGSVKLKKPDCYQVRESHVKTKRGSNEGTFFFSLPHLLRPSPVDFKADDVNIYYHRRVKLNFLIIQI